MLHELRIYRCVPGRLPALHKRFETVTLKMFEKHGIRQKGFWTVAIGENAQELYYILEWESLAEREQRWDAFASDPEWLAARAASEADGPIVASIVNTMLAPTPYSAVR
ncbi:MAG: NIPSNAP family protein [Burkholderiaceae bacterium]